MDGTTNISSSSGVSAVRGAPTGQAALNRRLAPRVDTRSRSITGGALWTAAALLSAIQLYGPDGSPYARGAYFAIFAFAVVMAIGCVALGPRLSPRAFAIGEEIVFASGWIVTAALVAATGGALSPNL